MPIAHVPVQRNYVTLSLIVKWTYAVWQKCIACGIHQAARFVDHLQWNTHDGQLSSRRANKYFARSGYISWQISTSIILSKFGILQERGRRGRGFVFKENKELTRKFEWASAARPLGITKENVAAYFSVLERTLTENELVNEPGRILNIDETELQLNNRPEHVVAVKGSKNIASVMSSKKGETISVIVCRNREGVYIPPTYIFKSKNSKLNIKMEYLLSPQFMSEKSALTRFPLQ